MSALLAAPGAAQQGADGLSFAVVGHIRGASDDQLHPKIDELIDELDRLDPDLLFLTGDMIWGMVEAPLADRAGLEAQWERLDAKLSRLDSRIYRVPGNHDLHDPVSRDVFFERYGEFPRAVTRGGSRFFLLNSTFTPEGDDPVPALRKPGKAERLASAQIRFLREELERESYEHEFLFMHHVLWFYPDDTWWTEVHPLLVEHGVDAVFTGDVGPGGMYTHVSRDGIEYYRNAVNAIAHGPLGEGDEGRLIRTVQFENFLLVEVEEDDVNYGVETVFETTSAAFQPDRWHDAFGLDRAPGRYFDPDTYDPVPSREPARRPGVVARAWDVVGSPRRLAALGAFAVLWLVVGWVIGRRVGAGRSKPARATDRA